MTETLLPEEIKPALQNGLPCVVVTCSKAGIPNVTYISQVYFVDDRHIAVSFQFFNKTIRNVRENPNVTVALTDLAGESYWTLAARYIRSETDGPIFDEMDMQVEAIASATGMSGVFKLKAADIYEVDSCTRIHMSGE